eukprot:CAMPEP_0198661168 /NCGR_PEP_ID=MMETSP1467-20131203/40310_1 /TAXON_ID=1462469 /ORGANISM="unid. sp., Strain CCMP2135" /LENGTH=142 /DNA_ID=CAMNT_0044397595 /DNA_START=54 /DNA_END=479 /DNA_ORIENTATION=+
MSLAGVVERYGGVVFCEGQVGGEFVGDVRADEAEGPEAGVRRKGVEEVAGVEAEVGWREAFFESAGEEEVVSGEAVEDDDDAVEGAREDVEFAGADRRPAAVPPAAQAPVQAVEELGVPVRRRERAALRARQVHQPHVVHLV